jgi:hypothetical protein
VDLVSLVAELAETAAEVSTLVAELVQATVDFAHGFAVDVTRADRRPSSYRPPQTSRTGLPWTSLAQTAADLAHRLAVDLARRGRRPHLPARDLKE